MRIAFAIRMQWRFLPVVALVFLSACVEVNDFGAYWAKGFVDPAVAGRWKRIAVRGVTEPSATGADQLIFTRDGSSYAAQAVNPIEATLSADEKAEREKDNATRMSVRTLRIRNRTFFMVRQNDGTTGGMIARYEIARGILREYWLYHAMAEEFLADKHPNALNFKRQTDMGQFVSIETFDEEVERILSEALSDPNLWLLMNQYRKIS